MTFCRTARRVNALDMRPVYVVYKRFERTHHQEIVNWCLETARHLVSELDGALSVESEAGNYARWSCLHAARGEAEEAICQAVARLQRQRSCASTLKRIVRCWAWYGAYADPVATMKHTLLGFHGNAIDSLAGLSHDDA